MLINADSLINLETIKPKVNEIFERPLITFIPNVGQIHSKVNYYIKERNFRIYFTKKKVVFHFIKKFCNSGSCKILSSHNVNKEAVLSLNFINANPNVKIEGQIEDTGKINYFIGNNPEKWYTDINTYKKIIYHQLWKGVDLIFYNANGQLKYDYIIQPGAAIEDIKFTYKGAESLYLDEMGNLFIKNKFGTLSEESPLSYQKIKGENVPVKCFFEIKKLKNKEISCGFSVEDNYNSQYPLVIDPGLVYSTFLGGRGNDEGYDIAVDNSGNAYVTGLTWSIDFPTTEGAFHTVKRGRSDVLISKINSEGTNIIYSTFLGGEGWDIGYGIAVDTIGNAYITGFTRSSNFPTKNAIQTSPQGAGDAFVTKLNADGSELIYSTYLGGSAEDVARGIDIDKKGNVYVAGYTREPMQGKDFPTTVGAYRECFQGGFRDAFAVKLNANGTKLIYSTYLGGNSIDEGYGIVVDDNGNAYIAGYTNSLNFPTTTGAYQQDKKNVFVTKLKADGSGLVYSAAFGGTIGESKCYGIDIDSHRNVYITGYTDSENFPATHGAYQTYKKKRNAFVTKLKADGTALEYSTFLGGENRAIGNDIAVDNKGNVYITGYTTSSAFPLTSNAHQVNYNGYGDAFVTKLNVNKRALEYSTFLGGGNRDIGNGIAVDDMGNVYVVGYTKSSDFPTSDSEEKPIGKVVFVTKLSTVEEEILQENSLYEDGLQENSSYKESLHENNLHENNSYEDNSCERSRGIRYLDFI